jgi:hypothetical protein
MKPVLVNSLLQEANELTAIMTASRKSASANQKSKIRINATHSRTDPTTRRAGAPGRAQRNLRHYRRKEQTRAENLSVAEYTCHAACEFLRRAAGIAQRVSGYRSTRLGAPRDLSLTLCDGGISLGDRPGAGVLS